jgi:hypothetical protein
MWRMVVWSPYFDSRTSWYANGWVYDDAYAIYKGSPMEREHPEWILKDASGNRLYIPFACSGGTCPQYAGDISNPAFRQAWIDELKAEMAHGYRGVFVDDVNMDMQVGNGAEEKVPPVDSSTGRAMSATQWRAYMATFMQEVRTQLPNAEIAHNVIWFAAEHAGTADPSIKAEIEAANTVFLERGANDSGLTGGTGQWSLNALLSFVDQVHTLGRGVVLDGTASDPHGLEYNLANYFLISDGQDAVRGGGQSPESWWPGWSVNLGEATAGRYVWNQLLRRDFSGGIALVNPPAAASVTVSLPVGMLNAQGETVTSVTLAGGSGVVLQMAGGAGTLEGVHTETPLTSPQESPGGQTPTSGKSAAGPVIGGKAGSHHVPRRGHVARSAHVTVRHIHARAAVMRRTAHLRLRERRRGHKHALRHKHRRKAGHSARARMRALHVLRAHNHRGPASG